MGNGSTRAGSGPPGSNARALDTEGERVLPALLEPGEEAGPERCSGASQGLGAAQRLPRRPAVQKCFQQQGVKQLLGGQGRTLAGIRLPASRKRQAQTCVTEAGDAGTSPRGRAGVVPRRAPVHPQHRLNPV